VFNQRSLYNAYKKRTKHIPYTMEEYIKAKESDPDFFRDESSLEYGKVRL
jgi:pre-mRNA-splicing factor SYF2